MKDEEEDGDANVGACALNSSLATGFPKSLSKPAFCCVSTTFRLVPLVGWFLNSSSESFIVITSICDFEVAEVVIAFGDIVD